MIHWATANLKATNFYDRYCTRRKALPDIAENSATWSYKASMNIRDPKHTVWSATHTLSFRSLLKNAMIPVISEFLRAEDFSTKKCVALMTKIREYYHANKVVNYTYGIAQKWVNIAIKYYIILNSFNAPTHTCDVNAFYIRKGYTISSPYVFNYHLFPVDTSYGRKLIGLKGIDFWAYSGGVSWHECDNISVFEKYWDDVDHALSPDDLPPNVYEIEHF